jgi:hypothetical protein
MVLDAAVVSIAELSFLLQAPIVNAAVAMTATLNFDAFTNIVPSQRVEKKDRSDVRGGIVVCTIF